MGILFPRHVVDKVFDSFDTDGSGLLCYHELILRVRRAAFHKGFIPKPRPNQRSSMSRLNAYWERRNRMVVEDHTRSVSELRSEQQLRRDQQRDEARAELVGQLRSKRETRRREALHRGEVFAARRQREDLHARAVVDAHNTAYNASVRFLPAVPEAAALARRTWAREAVRVATAEREEEVSRINELSDVWVGSIVKAWAAPSQETVLVTNLKKVKKAGEGKAPKAKDFRLVPSAAALR